MYLYFWEVLFLFEKKKIELKIYNLALFLCIITHFYLIMILIRSFYDFLGGYISVKISAKNTTHN
jgi:hypothetical protein